MRVYGSGRKGGAGIEALIKSSEERHRSRLGEIADEITRRVREGCVRMVLVSGPSSSGKTTFAGRLCSQLERRGLQPVQISMDDYFVDRDKTPLDADGKYDFEAVEAVDLALLNEQLKVLSEGGEVVPPLFDFVAGKRVWRSEPLRLGAGGVVIMEGLHALNPRLTELIADNCKFRIFVSCLTPDISPEGARISTFDVRLLRRITRDSAHRGKSVADTLELWPSVRRGEELYVFPFLSEADTVFDSSLAYDLSALRPLAEPLLRETPGAEAGRLLEILRSVEPVSADKVPEDSLLLEFVGR